MKIEYTKSTGGKLAFFKDLYEHAKALLETDTEQLERNWKQYEGDPAIDGSPENATIVRNITYELIESQVSSHVPSPHVDPSVQSERNLRNARSIEMLLKRLRVDLSVEEINDLDERYSYIYGASVWLVEWDESQQTNTSVGGIKLSCIPPLDFVPQPNIYNIDDMEYCFIKFTSTVDQLIRKYNVSEDVADNVELFDTGDEDTAAVVVCFYKDEDGKVCQYAFSGDAELLDIEDYYSRKIKICKHCGEREELCTCENPKKSYYELRNNEYEELEEDIVLSDGVSIIPRMSPKIKDGQIVTKQVEVQDSDPVTGALLFDNVNGTMIPRMITVEEPVMVKTKLPYYTPNVLPIVIRKNTSKERSLFGQSDCAYIRPQQQAINKVESRIMQKLMRSGVTPIMPEDASITMNNAIFGNIIKIKPGETASQYGKVDTTPDISKDIAEAERLYDHAKRILGISDSFQGQYDPSAKSGVAKQVQVNQSAGRLQSKRKMKSAAYSRLDEIIFQYHLAYADEPRPASFKDQFGRIQNTVFNRYDFIRVDPAGNYYYEDEYLFSVDESVDPEQNRQTLWEYNLNNLRTGTLGNPQDPMTLLRYWQAQENAHYPNARDNVEYFSQIVEQMQQAQQQQITPEGDMSNGV